MLLRMASPMKRPDSTAFYLRQRIPADVLKIAQGRTLRVPMGDGVAVLRLGRKADQPQIAFSMCGIAPFSAASVAPAFRSPWALQWRRLASSHQLRRCWRRQPGYA